MTFSGLDARLCTLFQHFQPFFRMAEQSHTPYARLYGTSAPSTHNSSAISSQQHLNSFSQPEWQPSAHQPWHSQVQAQIANGLPWLAHPQHVLPAHDTTAHGPAIISAPPWLSAHDNPMHQDGGPQAPQWLPARPVCQQPGLQQAHAAHHPSSTGHVNHIQPTNSNLNKSPHIMTPFTSQGHQSIDQAAEEVPKKRQRINDYITDCHKSSSKEGGKPHILADPAVSAASTQGVRDADGQGKNIVLIWDVDETLVLFLSLLDGSFAEAFGMQVSNPVTHQS